MTPDRPLDTHPAAPPEAGSEAVDGISDALDPVIQAFDAVCERLSGFESGLDAEWIDGYLTALAASWRAITLQEALPPMAGDVFGRVFADPQDVAHATAALQGRLDMLRAQLDAEALYEDADTLRLAPLMQDWSALDDAERQRLREEHGDAVDDLRTGLLWGDGFFTAINDFADDWPPPRKRDGDAAQDFAMLRRTVEMLVDSPQDPAYQAFLAEHWPADAPPTRDEIVDEALFAVQELRVWWAAHPPAREPLRAAATPGRNDPCSCGSGRKFKKCCGAA